MLLPLGPPARRALARPFAVAAAVAALASLASVVTAQENVPLDEILRRVGAYVSRYEREMTNVVAEERYVQYASGTGAMTTRTTRSDVGIVLDGYSGWMTLRDVFEVDGRSVRDRENRIAELLMQREANRNDPALAELIVKEGARFNLDPPGMQLPRTINAPMIVLKFARLQNQPRSTFRVERRGARDGGPTALVSFRERVRPRLITSPDQAEASGTMLVSTTSGEVLETELRLMTGDTSVTVQTRFERPVPNGLRVPVMMKETYSVTPARQLSRLLEAEATYSRFRTFDVITSTNVTGGGP